LAYMSLISCGSARYCLTFVLNCSVVRVVVVVVAADAVVVELSFPVVVAECNCPLLDKLPPPPPVAASVVAAAVVSSR